MSQMLNKLENFIIELASDDTKVFKTTPRELIGTFLWARRTSNCRAQIDAYLTKNNLEVEPGYIDVWVDSEITIKHKAKATTKLVDPVKKVMLLDAANKIPMTIKAESSLKEAISKMVFHNYSQLPVMSGERDIKGFISWETIGSALASGVNSDVVKDYINKDIKIIPHDTPLLNAIKTVYNNGFVVVKAQDGKICGIVTTTDISSQFLKMTEPFLLLEQIENYIRRILNKRVLQEELKKLCKDDDKRIVGSIDDLNFGEYIRLIQNPKIWEKLELSVDKSFFVGKLDSIREIRNDIMHFDPDGISPEQLEELHSMSHLLSTIIGYRK